MKEAAREESPRHRRTHARLPDGRQPQPASNGTAPITEPTEVSALTTPTTQVMENPDGSFTLHASRLPVRAKKNGSWAPIDTALRVEGSVLTPGNSTAPVTFSGGGSGPLVTISDGTQQVAQTWPTPLPPPVITGELADTATYPSVRPGIDLQLIATSTGYNQILVVQNASAAADLIANPIRVTLTSKGGTLQTDVNGGVNSTAPNGAALEGSSPAMWDSSNPNGEGRPSRYNPAGGKVRRVKLPLTAPGTTSSTVAIQPDQTVLDDPTTVYPLYVDPSMNNRPKANYLTVQSGGWDYYNNTTEFMRFGYCGWAGCTSNQGNARSLFSFDLTALTGKPTTAHIYTATLYTLQVYGATSAANPVNLMQAGAFTAATNYPGPVSAIIDTKSSNAGYNTNPSDNIVWNNTNLLNYVQAAATNDTPILNFALSAPTENVAAYWKKFGINPTIDIDYVFPPSTPTNFTFGSSVTCPNQPVYVRDATPTFYAKAINNNPDASTMGLWFRVFYYPPGSTVVSKNTTAVPATSGALASWTTSATNSSNPGNMSQGPYAVMVRAQSPLDSETATTSQYSAWTGTYGFIIDTIAPATPAITSYTYPRNYWGSSAAAPGTFTLASTADTAGFTYAYDNGTPPAITDTTCGYTGTGLVAASSNGTATLTAPSTLAAGQHTLTVKAFDDAHNTTAATTYTFYVAPTISGVPTANAKNLQEAETLPQTAPPGAYTYTENLTTASAAKQSHLIANQPTTFTHTITAPTDAYYTLGIALTTCNHCATLRFAIDGNPATTTSGDPLTINTNTPTTATTYAMLGGYQLTAGPHTLTTQLTTTTGSDYTYTGTYGTTTLTNYHDNGYTAALDYITIAPLRTPTATNLTAAFNNRATGTDNTPTTANADLTGQALSNTAIATAHLTPGSTITIGTPTTGGATFTIPATQAGTANDNVIALGQTISLQQPDGTYPTPGTATNPGYINLLTMATCGTIPTHPTRALTLTIPHTPNPLNPTIQIPTTTNWTTTPTTTPNVQTSQILQGPNGTPNTTLKPTLYVMKLPVPEDNAGQPITSITLPRIGTDLTNTCQTPALHIFAISTSQD